MKTNSIFPDNILFIYFICFFYLYIVIVLYMLFGIKRVNENINKLWGEFTEGKLTSFELLSKVAKIYGPREDRNELEAEERQMN